MRERKHAEVMSEKVEEKIEIAEMNTVGKKSTRPFPKFRKQQKREKEKRDGGGMRKNVLV